MEAVGTPRNHAEALGDLLVEADYRGHYSHGMNRLGTKYFIFQYSKHTRQEELRLILISCLCNNDMNLLCFRIINKIIIFVYQ